MESPVRDRIKGLRRVRAGDLIHNVNNWRKHPTAQSDLLKSLLREVGYVDALLAREDENGALVLIDGHLRTEVTPDTEVPVLVLDVDEHEANKILASLDPLAAMAEADQEALNRLLQSVDFDNSLIEDTLRDWGDLQDDDDDSDDSGEADDQTDQLEDHYAVLVNCEGEQDQGAILEELTRHDLDVRAICAGVPKRQQQAEPQEPPNPGAVRIEREVNVKRSPRVVQMEGMYDVEPQEKNKRVWDVELNLDEHDWQIGLIVGPSGSGKSTIISELFGEAVVEDWPWPEDASILDGFPEELGIQEIVGLLSSVGLSSPPSWVKPYHVLSNGERFRCNLARTLAEKPDLAVVDEFTSVVDRQVAQIGSAAVAKTVRRNKRQRFVAVTCHYDVEEWLQPDWKYDLKEGRLVWRWVQRRPDIQLSIRQVDSSQWSVFRHHHYLSGDLHQGAKCFQGDVNGHPAAFVAVLHSPHPAGGWWREHRCVCMPDFQGVGIGNKMSEYVASLFAASGKPYRSTTSHPAMIYYRARSPLWNMIRKPSIADPGTGRNKARENGHIRGYHSATRLTAGFEYVGPRSFEDAAGFGVLES